MYILYCTIGKLFKYNKLTNIITNCNYIKDYLFNTKYPPSINKYVMVIYSISVVDVLILDIL